MISLEFPITPPYKADILRQYGRNLSRCPVVKAEVDAFLQGKDETFSLCLQYLYGHMAAQDVLSTSIALLANYVQASLDALRQIEYVKDVPQEIFFPYVLYHRVNSECLDDSRGYLMEELLPHVQKKSMEQAALAVNYWCYAHATYTPADDRTLGPLAVLRRTLGRCGEESVLAVAALRSVGIPARQCYCPRWSHCDDNHAWVEVWIDGDWHYMGACEPEPVLDRGWFTAAASRAMRVDTREWYGEELYETVNCTARYTDTRILTVRVTENGNPVSGAKVRFQIVNYSELFTLWEETTNEAGLVRFETGAGDLFVYAQLGEKVALEKVDLRLQDSVTVELQTTFPSQLQADLVPPADHSGVVPFDDSECHRQLLRQCEAHLAAHRAAANATEVEAFLQEDRYPLSLKEELLGTLRPKDLVDITCETLTDALETANAGRENYPEDIFRNYILAPRIADEMLLPERQKIRSLFPDGFADPKAVLSWMRSSMQILPDEGVSHYYPSAYGCLRCRQVPTFAFDMVFVALCRAFCFPARLEPHTGHAQWFAGSIWYGIRPESAPVTLTLTAEKKLNYFEHFTLGIWDGCDFKTLKYPDLVIDGSHIFRLQPGTYRITVTTRQIDGTASVSLWHMALSKDQTLCVTPPEDQTPRRLKRIPLSLPEGPLKAELARKAGRNLMLIFAEPGSEPTEHLLTEMLEIREELRSLSCRILLLVADAEARTHPTLQRLQLQLPNIEVLCLQDPEALAALHRQMQVGDLRLPFVICADRSGRGVYADANYRIRMAQTLLDIQKLLASRQDPNDPPTFFC